MSTCLCICDSSLRFLIGRVQWRISFRFQLQPLPFYLIFQAFTKQPKNRQRCFDMGVHQGPTVNSVCIKPASFAETVHCLQAMQPSWHMLEYSSDFIVLSIFWCANLVFCIRHQWIVCGALIDTRITFGACDVLHSLLVERRKSPHPGTFQLNDASSILVDVLTNRSNVVVILIVVDVDDEWIIDECERLHPLKDAIEKTKPVSIKLISPNI